MGIIFGAFFLIREYIPKADGIRQTPNGGHRFSEQIEENEGLSPANDEKDSPVSGDDNNDVEDNPQITSVPNNGYINISGMTIKERYSLPQGYSRVSAEEGSFGEFLRNQRLKPYGEKSLYYDGREKPSAGIYDGVMDVDIGNRDLHQCADAIMLLRGEYLYSLGAYEDINFNFVSGFRAEYKKWTDGYRIKVNGNKVEYYRGADPSNTHEDFRKFMDMVMAYASTLSLEKELESVHIQDLDIGDVFIIGGSPGHAVIVVDVAESADNEKMFLLAQSYMPAQQTQIIINPMDRDISPWYSLDGKDELITPEWRFSLDNLKGFRSND